MEQKLKYNEMLIDILLLLMLPETLGDINLCFQQKVAKLNAIIPLANSSFLHL